MKRCLSVFLSLICLFGMVLPASAEEKNWDLNGRTVTLGSYRNLAPSENSPTYADEVQLIEDIEKKYNCKLEFITTGDFHSWDAVVKVQAMSGEKVADAFCHVIDYILPTWVYADLLSPLDDYIDMDDEMWNKNAMDPWKYQGKNYTVSVSDDAPGTVILFNKRICASMGITDEYLYELQENREWTWDKLLELARKCTLDTNNDGATDIWGFGAYGSAPVIAESFVYANGGQCVTVDENLKYTYALNTPEAIEAIEWCRALVNDYGICYSDAWSWGMWEKLWNRGKIAFYQVYSWEVTNYTSNLEDDEFGILAIPIGPQADDYANAQNIHDGWFIQNCVEDKEAIAAILTDFLYPYDWKDEVEAWERFDNIVFDDESIDSLRIMTERSVLALGENATWFRDHVLWSDFGVNSNIPGRVFAETYENPSQESLDALSSLVQPEIKIE